MTLKRHAPILGIRPALAIGLLSALTLSACSSTDDTESDRADSSATQTSEIAAQPSPTYAETQTSDADTDGSASEGQESVLASAGAGSQYALVDITSDGTSELLLKKPDVNGRNNGTPSIEVYSDDGVRLPVTDLRDEAFTEGAASAGAGRYSLHASADNDGLLFTTGMSMDQTATTDLWQVSGSTVNRSQQEWTYPSNSEPAIPADLAAKMVPIDWQDTPSSGSGANSGDAAASNANANKTAPDSQIGGTCGTVDGATVTAADNTSCGFAINVAATALSTQFGADVAASPTDPTFAGVANVSATSPGTGETYDMSCKINSDGNSMNCSGGNNASVGISGKSLLYLVG